ncbi:beta-lactamase superfamily domain-containing protein, partial [Melampsora americana]
KPSHHDPTGNGFRNPWPSATQQPSNSLFNTFLTRGLPLELARKPELESTLHPTVCVPAQLDLYDGFMPQDWKTRRSNKLIATWLGHAGCLVQLPTSSSTSQSNRPFRALFDPMFSARAGPSTFTGPKRLIGSPCRISDLPIVDVCCISHSHYDHLDYETVKELIKLQPHLKFYVPLGLKAWFSTTSVPVGQVIEMDWWDSQFFSSLSPFDEIISGGSGDQKSLPVRINCVPAQHSSGRSLLDQNTSLWCGWVIEQVEPARKRSSVYFAGDTGYRNSLNPDLCCPAFCEIGERYGPIDFSMIPIWRGGSLSFISWAGLRLADDSLLATHHASPIDAVKIHQEVKSSHSIAIHHGCFVGSSQESFDALQELENARNQLGVGDWMEKSGFGAIDVGV